MCVNDREGDSACVKVYEKRAKQTERWEKPLNVIISNDELPLKEEREGNWVSFASN